MAAVDAVALGEMCWVGGLWMPPASWLGPRRGICQGRESGACGKSDAERNHQAERAVVDNAVKASQIYRDHSADNPGISIWFTGISGGAP